MLAHPHRPATHTAHTRVYIENSLEPLCLYALQGAAQPGVDKKYDVHPEPPAHVTPRAGGSD